MTQYLKLLLTTMTISLLASSCKVESDERPVVTVSIEPLRYFAEQIGGDKFKVVTMVPGGASPETYEPTAQQMADLTESVLYIKVGDLGFERTWMKRMKANMQHLITVDASEGVAPLPTYAHHSDPHTWTSPANALQMANNICRAMILIDGKDSTIYHERLDSLAQRIMTLDAKIDSMLAKARARSFLIYHPALTYFARDYKLRQLAIEDNGREPSAATLKRLIDEARGDSVELMFVQKEFANRNVETVVKATGADTVVINPLSYDWEGEMLKIVEAICKRRK
jgi:zinc transport system substrate-binding protein